jgi:creatinine amidohydrolase/Fe(II)-dependent formamide hydrolase-like protein
MITYRDPSSRFKTDPPQAAILALAGFEAHENGLPPDVDQLIVMEIARRAAEKLPFQTVLLPAWPYGTPPQGEPGLGGVTLRYETLWRVVQDIVQSLFEHGIRQVAVINNHGSCADPSALPWGNAIVKTAVRQLNYEISGLTAIWVQPFRAGRGRLRALFSDDVETATVEKSIAEALALPPGTPSLGMRALEEVSEATAEYILSALCQLAELKAKE